MATGYGRDTWCGDSLQTGRMAFGVTLVVQAFYRRLTTPYGTLRHLGEVLDYGLDLAGYIGDNGFAKAQANLPGMIIAELSKDDRALGVDVSLASTRDDEGNIYLDITIEATLVESGENFRFTVRASDAVALLLGEPVIV